MKRKALTFGVIFILLMGFSQILTANTQETVLIRKLISAKEVAKELRDPDSERIKAFGYLVESDIASRQLQSWITVSAEVMLSVMFKMESDEEFLELMNNPVNFKEILFSQDFEFSKFEQEFTILQKFFTKIIIWLQESLDPSQPAHQQVLRESLDLLKKVLNPELFTQGYSQYKIDCFRTFYLYGFAQAWAEMTSVTLDKELVQEIAALGFTTQEYILDETVDKESEEFKKRVSDDMAKLNAKIEELIQFIEKL